MPVSSKQWEKVWREAGDEFLIESASDHLRRNLTSSLHPSRILTA
jgi:hypothetical protein